MLHLTPSVNGTDRQVEQMVGKAMCAYANLYEASNEDFRATNYDPSRREAVVAFESEYEATIRCIALFVEEHVPSICAYVIARAGEEFGI